MKYLIVIALVSYVLASTVSYEGKVEYGSGKLLAVSLYEKGLVTRVK